MGSAGLLSATHHLALADYQRVLAWPHYLFSVTVKLGEIGQPGLRQGSCRWPIGGVSKVGGKSKILGDLGFGTHLCQICFVDLRSVESKSLVTLAFLGAFGAEQGLLTYFADLSGPAWLHHLEPVLFVLFSGLWEALWTHLLTLQQHRVFSPTHPALSLWAWQVQLWHVRKKLIRGKDPM